MNNLNLREAIIKRVQDKSKDELTDIIKDSIGNDERTLPGLGVLFECIWQQSESDLQEQMVHRLHSSLAAAPDSQATAATAPANQPTK